MRWLIAIAIAVVAAGAAIGGLVAGGHGDWAALGGSVTGVTAAVGSALWDKAQERGRKADPETSAPAEGTGITITQKIGRLERDGKAHAIRGNPLMTAKTRIEQQVKKVGQGAEVVAVDNGSPDQS